MKAQCEHSSTIIGASLAIPSFVDPIIAPEQLDFSLLLQSSIPFPYKNLLVSISGYIW